MRAAAAAELRLHHRPSSAVYPASKMRRSGIMRGSEACHTHGNSVAWDPERAAKEAAARAMSAGIGDTGRISGTGKQCERPEEAYKDMRYRSYDTVCPVCRGQVAPNLALGGQKKFAEHPTQACKNPAEAYQDARYRSGDTVCPVCNGWLIQMRARDSLEDDAGGEKGNIRVWGQPDRWRHAGKGEVWRKQGLHVGFGRATIKQLSEQETEPHTETNPAEQYLLGCKLERKGEDLTRPVSDRESDLQQAADWFRAAAFQGHTQALYRLAMCYLQAKGVCKDLRQGVSLLRKAADLLEAEAAYELGNCYYRGVGVAKNENMALGWWRQAVGMGHLKASAAQCVLTYAHAC